MNRPINATWAQVSEKEFDTALALVSWKRDGWGNGDFYSVVGRDKNVELCSPMGMPYTLTMPHEVAVKTTDGRFFIAPDIMEQASAATEPAIPSSKTSNPTQ